MMSRKAYEAVRRLAQARVRAELAYYDSVAGLVARGERIVDLVDALGVSRWTVYRHAAEGDEAAGKAADIDELVGLDRARDAAKAGLRAAAARAKTDGATVTDIAHALGVTRATVYGWTR